MFKLRWLAGGIATAGLVAASRQSTECEAIGHKCMAWIFEAGVGRRAVASPLSDDVEQASWKAVALGDSLGCAVAVDGNVYTWTADKRGVVTQNLNQVQQLAKENVVDVAVAPAGLLGEEEGLYALTKSGSVLSVPPNDDAPAQKLNLGQAMRWTKINKITCGSEGHCMALGKNGRLVGWGLSNDSGQLGRQDATLPVETPSPVAQGSAKYLDVDCGQKHTAAVDSDGQVWVWGSNRWGQLGIPPWDNSGHLTPTALEELENISAAGVACGDSHTLVRSREGQVVSFGLGLFGQLGRRNLDHIGSPNQMSFLPENSKTASQIVAGANQTAVVATDGELYIFGSAIQPSPEVRAYLRSPRPSILLALGRTTTAILNIDGAQLRPRGKKI